MIESAPPTWLEANQRYLTEALAVVRGALECHIARRQDGQEAAAQHPAAGAKPQETVLTMSAPPALERLCAAFQLSPFERDLLLMCAGVELDSRFGALCAAAQNDPQRTHPTFSLALAALPAAHWSALTPTAPLRRWRLLELGAGSGLTLSPLRIDEWSLHFLTGVEHLDERLAAVIDPGPAEEPLVPSHQALVDQVAAIWSQTREGTAPPVQLCGPDTAGKRAVAAAVCARFGRTLGIAAAGALPAHPSEVEPLFRLWEREAALRGQALLLDGEDLDPTDTARAGTLDRWIERCRHLLFVASRERRPVRQRSLITLEVRKPCSTEQTALWQASLGPAAPGLNGHVERLTAQFDIGAVAIRAASAAALGWLAQTRDAAPGESADAGTDAVARVLWETCRSQSRPRLDNLAQRIEPAAGWDDLVLPEAQRQLLREIAAHVRQRVTVYERWGFAARGARGLGISALFAGVSGTGKTMAAEVLAREFNLDLYRVDLSSVVSKYIGETEKNLSRVFDTAEEGGAVLLFDEADALFGKRSEVKDSHDRYANIEVSYLLQRMETYRGLAILTTNLKNALDPAFLRRLRFVVQFPFPDATQRAEIWRRIFPEQTPTEGLDAQTLAQLTVSGGNIRNMALNAAFLAADAGEPVSMAHLLRAAQSEYAKLEKTLTDTEVAGWA